ncbi:alcohol dehydrogenase, propanol-preferring [Solimonas aquatica]|uniref:alcohol dehydrogenase n=2 Tax=Solimonas aquatica TaxID=489703 RepID=A0A1H9MCY2_9GAMM|nr:zinc-dependent alcohol dehydrogenase family protein [Solimonas aquatica]SER21441.1 alcohol dehydrogenase, propanol-preferring [Solimonas aquatica]
MMQAMVLQARGQPLVAQERPLPQPGPGQVLIEVAACGVCRTDLHLLDGELDPIAYPIVPGHQVVGRVLQLGAGVTQLRGGQRVGLPWLGHTCGHCVYCAHDEENLCEDARFTGWQRDGGYATHCLAEADYVLPLPEGYDDLAVAPLLCAGLIGYRALRFCAEARRIGFYGFGAAAHVIAQLARWQKREVYAFTRSGDSAAQQFARRLGAIWAGGSDEPSPEALDAAIIFAAAGELVPAALRAVRKGGRVVCGGIHMSDIPSFPYADLWGERSIQSVANLTRRDAREFLALAPQVPIHTQTRCYPLAQANQALADLRAGRLLGAAVLTMK